MCTTICYIILDIYNEMLCADSFGTQKMMASTPPFQSGVLTTGNAVSLEDIKG